MKLTLVIPVYNEADNISPLTAEIQDALNGFIDSYEIIFINDGSDDNTVSVLSDLSSKNPAIRAIHLAQNKGQSFATWQGILSAKGELICFLDGDLQNNPADLPAMVTKLESGFDVVCGWRRQRQDKKVFVFSSIVANFIIRKLFLMHTHDSGCSLRVTYTRHLRKIRFFEHFHRYIPILLHLQDLLVTELVVNHRYRTKGESKYKITKSFGVLKELLYLRFFYKPLNASNA